MIVATIASALLVYIDHHWSCVVKFYATYPQNKTKGVNWLSSDSEPQFQFQNDPKAEEHNMDVSSIIANKKMVHLVQNEDGEYVFDTQAKINQNERSAMDVEEVLEDYEYNRALE